MPHTTTADSGRERIKKRIVGHCPPLHNLSLRSYQDVLADIVLSEVQEARLDELDIVPYISDRFDVYKSRRRAELSPPTTEGQTDAQGL